jgi:serine/threonine protein phosphatase PrpC
LVYTEEQVAKMIFEMRKKRTPLEVISQKITDEAHINYNCKDNVTLIIIDLKKHFIDF